MNDIFGEITDSLGKSTQRMTDPIADALNKSCNPVILTLFGAIAIFGTVAILRTIGIIGHPQEEKIVVAFPEGRCSTIVDVYQERERFEYSHPDRTVFRMEYKTKGCLDEVTFFHTPKPQLTHPLIPPKEGN